MAGIPASGLLVHSATVGSQHIRQMPLNFLSYTVFSLRIDSLRRTNLERPSAKPLEQKHTSPFRFVSYPLEPVEALLFALG